MFSGVARCTLHTGGKMQENLKHLQHQDEEKNGRQLPIFSVFDLHVRR